MKKRVYKRKGGRLLYTMDANALVCYAAYLIKNYKALSSPVEVHTEVSSVLTGKKPAYLTLGGSVADIQAQFDAEVWNRLVSLAEEDTEWSMLITPGTNYRNPQLVFVEVWFAPTENVVTISAVVDLLDTIADSNRTLSQLSLQDKGVLMDILNQSVTGVLLGYPSSDIARFLSERIVRMKASRLTKIMYGDATNKGKLEDSLCP